MCFRQEKLLEPLLALEGEKRVTVSTVYRLGLLLAGTSQGETLHTLKLKLIFIDFSFVPSHD